MAPKQPSLDLLFHPKKNKKSQQQQPPRRTPPTPRPKSTPGKKDEDEGLQLPDWQFQDFRLLSSALNGWKYDVIKFDSRKIQDVSKWTAPVKLNRKDLRKDEPAIGTVPQAVGPMLGPDGKPVIGADGKVVMVDAEGKPIHPAESSGLGKEKGKASAANSVAAAKKRFQKKTRQVFYVPEEVRQLRKEERYPWVMEDSNSVQDNKELWIGQLEDVSRAETNAFFMPAANDVFKFVPAHRWYKFQKKLKHGLPTDTAGVEQLYTTTQKRDPQAWLASRNGGKGASTATTAMFKAEAEGRTITIGNSLVHDAGQSLGPGGRRLKTVDSGMDHLFGGDEDEDGEFKKRRAKEMGGDGDMDEQVYEEDFADDDEHAAPDDNDEEAKEAEERLKREYRAANKHREAGIDEDEDEPENPHMSKQAKAMQKLIRSREGNDVYESDDDNRNPYASSEEEEEEEELPVPAGPAIQQQPQQVDVQVKSQTPKSGDTLKPQSDVNGSQATSPLASPSLGGHSIVAKRATSPKAPKPLNQGVSKPSSPANSRATSPAAGSRATSPVANGQKLVNNKRKADDTVNSSGPSPNGQPKLKKRREVVPVTQEEMQALLIEWLKTSPKEKATTRECIQHFTPYLTDQAKKAEFSKMVREVAMLKDGILVLRANATSAAPSPAPMAQ